MSRRRGLSPEERSLWKRVTRDVRRSLIEAGREPPDPADPAGPTWPAGPRLGETDADTAFPLRSKAGPPAPAGKRPKSDGTDGGKTRPSPRASLAPRPSPAPPPSPPSAFAGGDPAAEKRVRRGRARPERTLDLHGLRQGPAKARLGAFLEQAAGEGLRCVLVVTGKGAPDDSTDHEAYFPYTDREPRGVLRRRFAQWIDEPPLRGLVARVAPASPKDGGTGAFYVFLKSAKREP